MKKFLFILTLLISFTVSSQTLPRQISLDDQIIHYNGFTISYNNTHEQPNWVFYTMDSTDVACDSKAKRKNNFCNIIVLILPPRNHIKMITREVVMIEVTLNLQQTKVATKTK